MATPRSHPGLLAIGAAFMLVCGTLAAQPAEVVGLQRAVEQARPAPEALSFYQLDWADSLDHALERAAREERPILYIWVTNITGPTDFFSGHC